MKLYSIVINSSLFLQIGIHSAKFTNERISKNVLSAVQKYNILHPVVNDASLQMWHDMGITFWPSLIMLGMISCAVIYYDILSYYCTFFTKFIKFS